MTEIRKRRFKTSDGVELNLLESGSGPALLMLPGWSQTAELFRPQLEGLSPHYRVLALDLRGHGESENAASGYRLSRMAMDVHEVLEQLELDAVHVLGHSMGNAVLWSHWELFGRDRFTRMIIAEEPLTLMARPAWSQEERAQVGCLAEPEEMAKNCDALEGDDAEAFAAEFVGGMLSSRVSEADRRFIVEQNLMLPRAAASTLLQSASTDDWRDLVPRIDIPTLIIAGKASIVPFTSQQWLHRHIPGSKLVAFEEEEGGYHFMFWENPEKFNRVVAEFLGCDVAYRRSFTVFG